jgi:hypothetical protein
MKNVFLKKIKYKKKEVIIIFRYENEKMALSLDGKINNTEWIKGKTLNEKSVQSIKQWVNTNEKYYTSV